MKSSIALITLIVILFSGCVNTQPDVPKYSINKSDKIGYIIDVSNKTGHTHIGTTVFNNMEKTYDYDFKMHKEIDDLLNKKVNVELINLADLGYSSKDLVDLIIAKDEKWVVGKSDLYKKLIGELKLKAVIFIKGGPTAFYMYPKVWEISASGLVSHNIFGLKRYSSLLSAKSSIYLLKPVGKIVVNRDPYVTMIYDSIMTSFQEKSGFKAPKDIENITIEELIPMHRMNLQQLDLLISQTSDYINR